MEGSEQPKQKSSLVINVLSELRNDTFTKITLTSKAEENFVGIGIIS